MNKYRKLFTVLLIIAAIVVWGSFFVRVKQAKAEDSQQTASIDNKVIETTRTDSLNIDFMGSFRDPFAHTPAPVEKKKETQPKHYPKPIVQRPDINITGVIGKTLILEFKGKSMVLSQDEQAEFGLIYSIEPDSVIVQVKDNFFTYKLAKDNRMELE